MYSDDEKDFLNNLDNDQDDTVSWDNIIDTDEDGIVSIKNDSSSKSDSEIPTEVFSNDVEVSDLDSLRNIIEDAETDIDSSDDNVIDEDELRRILNDDANPSVDYSAPAGNGYSDTTDSDESKILQDSDPTEDILPRKEEVKKQQVSPLLVALLFAILVAGATYLIFNFRSRNEEEDAIVNPPAQENVEAENNQDAVSDSAIPVVNEEEVDQLKPEENQEEKKETINVIPTGRTDPFLPLGKYLYKPVVAGKTQIKTINNIDYDSITIPKPPKKYGEISEFTQQLMTITVSGIMYDKIKPSAIITYHNEDYFVQIGDKLDDFKVVDIYPNSVIVSYGKNTYRANLGQELKIERISGLVRDNETIRRYRSSEEEQGSTGAKGTSPYTSNGDVGVYAR